MPRKSAAFRSIKLSIGGAGAAIRFHMDGNYSQATQAFDQFPTEAGESFIVNARLALADTRLAEGNQKLTVSAWARNLFDKQYIFRQDPSNSLPGAPTSSLTACSTGNVLGDGNFNAPRTFGIETTVKF